MKHPGLAAALLVLALGPLACTGGSSAKHDEAAVCVPPAPAESHGAAPLELQVLGTLAVGTRVGFTVPANAASVTVIEQLVAGSLTVTLPGGSVVPNAATPLRIEDPSGAVVLDRTVDPVDPTQAKLFFRSTAPGTGAVTLPNSSAGLQLVSSGVPGGPWTLTVSDLAHLCTVQPGRCAAGSASAAGRYAVTVIVKPGSGAANIPAAGALDVTLNLVPAGLTPPLSAATAATDPHVQRFVQTLGTLLGQAGISLGAVRYVDVPAATAADVAGGVPVDDTTACAPLSRLFLTAPAGRQVNVFLVGSLYSPQQPGAVLLGYDGEIPGPATLSPTAQSGVIVSAADLRVPANPSGGGLSVYCGVTPSYASCGADRTAYLAAHEIGHHLGLYHPTEQHGTAFDPLVDTASCACQACASDVAQCEGASPAPASPHSMTVAECSAGGSCGGGDNLMFWVLDSRHATGLLTAEQGRVLRASPAVY